MLERNSKNLMRIANEEKQIVHAMNMHNSEYVMICAMENNYISNTLKKLLLQSNLHSSYISYKMIKRES